MKKKIAIKKQQRAVKPKLRKAKAKKTAKEPEFFGRASSGGKLNRAEDKEYRRQMGWPAR